MTITINNTEYNLLTSKPAGDREMLVLQRPKGKRIAIAYRHSDGFISDVTTLLPGMAAAGYVSR